MKRDAIHDALSSDPAVRATLAALRRRIRGYVWIEAAAAAVAWLGVGVLGQPGGRIGSSSRRPPSASLMLAAAAIATAVRPDPADRPLRLRAAGRQQRGHRAGAAIPAAQRQPADGRGAGRPPAGGGGLQSRHAGPHLRARRPAGSRASNWPACSTPCRCGGAWPRPCCCRRRSWSSRVAQTDALDIWARRTLALSDEIWPRKTQLTAMPWAGSSCWLQSGPVKVASGADLEVIVRGRHRQARWLPDRVEIRYRGEDGAAIAPR